MCYIDVMAADSYGRFNKKLAKMIGLSGAVYLDVLVNILNTVKRKDKFTDRSMGYFTVDRKYVTGETTLTTAEQKEFDALFESLNIMMVNPEDSKQVSLDLGALSAWLSDVKESDLKSTAEQIEILRSDLKKEKKVKAAAGKKLGMMNRWATWITGSDVVKDTYTKVFEMWYSRGIQTDAEVSSKVTTYEAVHDEALKLACLEKQLTTGWTDPKLVVSKATEEFKGNRSLPEQKVATKVGTNLF